MDLFGERWAMPVMRELLLGPRRFSGLKTSLNGISAKVLTGTPPAIATIIYGNRPLDDAIDDGELAISGDRTLIERLPACFPMPDPAA